MTDDLLPPLLTTLLLLVGFLSALACYSLRGFSRSRLDEICGRHGREERFGVILRRAESALLAVELFDTLVSLLLVLVAFNWLKLWQPPVATAPGWLAYLVELFLVLFVLVFSVVILPWTLARVVGERFLFRAWPLIGLMQAVARPVLILSRYMDTLAHRLSGLREPAGGDAATIAEEILTVVDEGQREGLLESEARTMIHRVMDLAEEDVAAVMTPRTDMHCIRADSSLEEARQIFLEVGHSRMPVIGESPDDVDGILYAKDLLKYLDLANHQQPVLTDIAREPFYVPETGGIDTLLETMRHKHVHLAIVLDEYGGVAGLVTMEDILEEIVGEIVDEYDAAEEVGVRQIKPGVHEIDARVHIDDLNEQFEYDLPENGDFDTIGGFTITQLGRVPEPGESFTWRQLRIIVLAADKRKILKLRIEVDSTLVATPSEET